jgi:hypothetical protein
VVKCRWDPALFILGGGGTKTVSSALPLPILSSNNNEYGHNQARTILLLIYKPSTYKDTEQNKMAAMQNALVLEKQGNISLRVSASCSHARGRMRGTNELPSAVAIISRQ